MPSAAGITVEILCDDKPLKEYPKEDDQSAPKTTSCWIASEAGKAFSVRVDWKALLPCTWDWGLYLHCDGSWIGGDLPESTFSSCTISSVRGGPLSRRPIQFSGIETSDSDAQCHETNPQLGCIALKIWRRSKELKYLDDGPGCQAGVKIDVLRVSEKAKILNGHQVSLGNAILAPKTRVATPTLLENTPFWTFNFYYRPEEILRAQEIIPPTQSTPEDKISDTPTLKRRASQDLDQDGSSDEDEDVIAAKVHVLNQQLKTIRARKKRKLKREESPIVIPDKNDEIIEISD